ncbi:glycoside-pentoside-hexuronide (GPH):cation symporter [Lachnobacterium bovis]|uniref:glycoside-pentoside-hexuronide (GPH):cation symporter n=1 Tax=Lachnobacterium bovis TaxID=140626 RepID=UPI00048BA617|nr:glycoside-pentoside-hexuronide (GPH):cation symporter [Lachnobacterium bovis]
MNEKRCLTAKEKVSYGLGAVGKDMVYMLSASYIQYYYYDLLGMSAMALGVILLIARVFDAFNDPIMGVVVAKTKTKWGKFRPWLLIGTVTNAIILFIMFACPPKLNGPGLVAYAAVFYILWGVTYTMMDIPFWSMIPAFTKGGSERESLTTLARSCAGVGSAIVQICALIVVHALGSAFGGHGNDSIEIIGFKWFSLIVACLFIIFTLITCINVKEKSTVDMETATVKQMFKALIQNDQAMSVVVTIVCVNTALYITSNLVIYFFKYDLGGANWYADNTLFNMVGGASQILAMMMLYPLLRVFFNSIKIFYISLSISIIGYVSLLVLAMCGIRCLAIFLIPGVLIMAAAGMNNVLVTVFLANTVDYGELKNGRRDESVIFSMQTFVVKLATGLAIFITSAALQFLNLKSGDASKAAQTMDLSKNVSQASKMGLRMVMTIIPILGLIFALVWFKNKYILTDSKLTEITNELEAKN